MSELGAELAEAFESMVKSRVAETSDHQVAEWDDELWATLASQGFTALDDPDVGFAEFVALAQSVGRNAVGLPVVETGIATWLASATGLSLNPDLVTLVSFNSELQGEHHPDGSLSVSGTLSRVPWGRRADAILAIAQVPGGSAVVMLKGLHPEHHGENLAGEPRDNFVVEHTVDAADFAAIEHRDISDLLLRGAVMRSASASGAMETALNLAVEYSTQREQFGKPISDFQAVQQLLVIAAEAFAMTDAAVLNVTENNGEYRRLLASVSKQISSQQSHEFTRAVHQIFAGIGATQEHKLHLFSRRLWSWQDECGSAHFWSREIARSLHTNNGIGLWELLTPPNPAMKPLNLQEVLQW